MNAVDTPLEACEDNHSIKDLSVRLGSIQQNYKGPWKGLLHWLGFGSQYRSSKVTLQGIEFGGKEEGDGGEFKDLLRSTWEVRASQ
ncbi:hypothetical protein GH714_011751 [Hevea brasiliensis]|uniref:Uncharacterized protein n=1 Tax=Hevea brasiliensis TaxID=3981 RepID=A0A6A6NGL5_HEVBR|nr:hypothetical protein GH714_011751 [Hevea brasiliensis]